MRNSIDVCQLTVGVQLFFVVTTDCLGRPRGRELALKECSPGWEGQAWRQGAVQERPGAIRAGRAGPGGREPSRGGQEPSGLGGPGTEATSRVISCESFLLMRK